MRALSFVFIVGSLGMGLQGCNSQTLNSDTNSQSADTDTAILRRLAEARGALVLESPSYAEISRDPVDSARKAVARRDYRLIAFYYSALAADPTPRFPGLRCSIPNVMQPIVQRAVWSHYVNDAGPSGPQPNRLFAERYNRAMVEDTSFPFGDLCIVDPMTNAAGDPVDPVQPYFSRLSSRKARPMGAGEENAIAIRNGEGPNFSDAAAINRPDTFGLTPLAWAGMRGSREMVEQLLANGADPWAGARCFVPPDKIDGLSYNDRFYTPLALTSQTGRADIVELMLSAQPRKKCSKPPGGAKPADAEVRVMLDMGRTLGSAANRRLFDLALRGVVKSPEAYSPDDTYDLLVKHAREFEFTDAFRNFSKTEAERMRGQLLAMAARGTSDELKYWVNRFNVRATTELADLLKNITRDMTYVCPKVQKCGRDGDAKLEWVLDRIGRPSTEQNATYVLAVFGSGLGPLDRDPILLRRIVTSFIKRGYRFDVGKECTLILSALSYSFRDECPLGETSPAFATLLLDLKVDVMQRTPSGLTTLDLAKRRSANGPYENAFAPIVVRLKQRGVPETNPPSLD